MPDKKIFYLTKDGLNQIKKEYQELRELKKLKATDQWPKFSNKINIQYSSFFNDEDTTALDERIQELEEILKYAKLIRQPSGRKISRVVLGSTVSVESEGQSDEFTIVGSIEANPSLGKISNESPVGQALLGKKINEIVKINSPEEIAYRIKRISYKKTK